MFAMLDELMAGLLDRIFLFLSSSPEALLASEGPDTPVNASDDLRAEVQSPTEPDSIESSTVVSPDTLSEPDVPSGRTFAELQIAGLRKAYLNLRLAILPADLGPVIATSSASHGARRADLGRVGRVAVLTWMRWRGRRCGQCRNGRRADNMRHMEPLLGSVLALAAAPDPQLVRQALTVLVRMVDAWAEPGPPFRLPSGGPPVPDGGQPGGLDGPVATPGGAGATGGSTSGGGTGSSGGAAGLPPITAAQRASIAKVHEAFPTIDQVIVERVLPACFSLPVVTQVKANDAETSLLVRDDAENKQGRHACTLTGPLDVASVGRMHTLVAPGAERARQRPAPRRAADRRTSGAVPVQRAAALAGPAQPRHRRLRRGDPPLGPQGLSSVLSGACNCASSFRG